MTENFVNIASRLQRMAEIRPDKSAVLFQHGRKPKGRRAYSLLTFRQLDRHSGQIARGLLRVGITRGTRTLLFVRPSPDFYALTFGLFKVGAVPVLIDPGMGRERLLHCIAGAAPEAMIGIPQAHVARILKPRFFRSIKVNITVGRRWFWRGFNMSQIRDADDDPLPATRTRADELAAVLFTTGSTGPAKGVMYEHGMFDAQCDLIARTYSVGPGDIDLPTFPLFGLFSVALGMTAVIPDMDPTRPGKVDPTVIVEAITDNGCTFSFGSPALWKRVTAYCRRSGIRLPTLKKVLMAGAPIPPELHAAFRDVLTGDFETHTPYGATESLPVTNMTGTEVLAETGELTRAGRGFCVGRPVDGITVRVIRETDGKIERWSDDLAVAPGGVGEIAVRGPVVTKSYFNLPEETERAKIRDGVNVWHRIGDVGRFDDKGRLWYLGRKVHAVSTAGGTMYTVCCEAIFNRHPAVRRSALVGIGPRGRQTPVIVVEPEDNADSATLRDELLALAAKHPLTEKIRELLFHPSFPVDIRHNAKIFREELAAWAAGKLKLPAET